VSFSPLVGSGALAAVCSTTSGWQGRQSFRGNTLRTSLLLLIGSLLLTACASFDPYNGMAFEEFRHTAGLAGKGGAELVGRNGTTTVYFLNGVTDHNVFYWFEEGVLRKVTNGTLPQTKHALKTMYKPAHLRGKGKKKRA
jgi:hypothetical protein